MLRGVDLLLDRCETHTPPLTLDPPYHALLQVITMPPKHNKMRKQSKEVNKKANEMEEDMMVGMSLRMQDIDK
jgi:hypothetical protein